MASQYELQKAWTISIMAGDEPKPAPRNDEEKQWLADLVKGLKDLKARGVAVDLPND